MKKAQSIGMALFIATLLAGQGLRAEDINLPPWARFQANTTYEDWTFSTSANPLTPDPGFNPNGTPMATVSSGTWAYNYDQLLGYWTLGDARDSDISLFIPNTPFELEPKTVWVQLTWELDGGEQAPCLCLSTTDTYCYHHRMSLVESESLGVGDWMQSTYEATIPFNPSWEVVTIRGPIDVAEVVVDTICPEPSTFALLGAGAAGLLVCVWRRRRRTA